MFAIPGIVLLLLHSYLQPQTLIVELQALPLLPLFFALALFGLAVDLKLRQSQLVAAPQLGWASAFIGWTLLSVGLQARGGAQPAATGLAASFLTFFVIAQGVQSFRALSILAATLLSSALCLAAVAARRGVLADPDPQALALGIALPFAFAFFERKRSAARGLLLALTVALVGLCVLVTRSRGGQLVVLTVLGVYLVKRYGARGLVAGAFVAAPLLLLVGDGSGGLATARPGALHAALDLLRRHPWRGLGYGQAALPVHDSFALVGAEGGLAGLFLWTSMLYLSIKVVLTILRRYADDADAAVARLWAWALLASLAGMSIGAFILSFCYHAVFWIYVGLVGGLYQATRAHDPKLEIHFQRRDLFRIAAIDAAIVAGLWVCTALKLA